jgi:hypothetical protein
MIQLKCPKCQSEVEIEDKDIDGKQRTVVFCKTKDCFFYDKPLIGLSRDETKDDYGVYISESII